MDVQKLKHFLRPLIIINNNGYGYGNGYGNGYGYGNGNGYGSGNGYGYGSSNGDSYGDGYGDGDGGGNGDGNGDGGGNGDGYGDGDGDGGGNGYGIKKFNKQNIYIIDKIQTSITFVKNDVAKGFILLSNLTLQPCYIVRNDYHYAHGKTIKEALKSLQDKTYSNLPVEKRIENFKKEFKDYSKKVKGNILYNWHFKLTCSCKLGRDNFCKENNIDLTKSYTINEFIKLTENSYGGDIIKQLR